MKGWYCSAFILAKHQGGESYCYSGKAIDCTRIFASGRVPIQKRYFGITVNSIPGRFKKVGSIKIMVDTGLVLELMECKTHG